MVYISRVYTRFGDRGETMLASGETTGKDNQRVRAYGDVDELNSVIGWLRLEIERAPGRGDHLAFVTELDAALARIQQELFDLGAELAGGTLQIDEASVTRLEAEIDAMNEHLAPLRSFILPGGGPIGSVAHVARTVCRRAEREAVALDHEALIRGEALRYLNRLSDFLFVVARAAAHEFGIPEVLWDPARAR
ncbi:MAG: cob(I)yrinic acid a,c-diamide adenosyltransferase [Nannocystaceae bacterium]